MLRNLLIILLVFGSLGAIVAFLANGIQDVSVERFEITQLTGVSLESFTVAGNLYINNPSKLPIQVENIKYDLILRDTNQTISYGNIIAFRLNPGLNQVPFSHATNWAPSINTLLRLGAQQHVYADIKGKVFIDVFGLKTYEVPFTKEVDLKAVLTQKTTQKAGVPAEVLPTTGAIPETPDTSTASLTDLTSSLF